jgi:hypothetical protein
MNALNAVDKYEDLQNNNLLISEIELNLEPTLSTVVKSNEESHHQVGLLH